LKPLCITGLRRTAALALATAALALGAASSAATTDVGPGRSDPDFRRWIVEMKDSARGPFAGIKWYCKDGSVFPPTEYA